MRHHPDALLLHRRPRGLRTLGAAFVLAAASAVFAFTPAHAAAVVQISDPDTANDSATCTVISVLLATCP